MSGRIRVVLVEPQEPGNVGAVARAMKNFGLADLVIVGSPVRAVGQALWWSSGAEDLFERARYTSSLAEALADSHVNVATTSSRGRVIEDLLTPAQTAELVSSLADAQTISIVFGRESRGLTSDELALCGVHATIPTNPEFPVMNLAQSVAIFGYELAKPREESVQPRDLAPAHLVERMHEKGMRLLVDAGYLHTAHPERLYRELRALAARAQLTRREVDVLLGAIAKLEWKIRQAS